VLDNEPRRAALPQRGIELVIPSRRTTIVQPEIDTNLYRDRNKIERFWNHLKQYQQCATRYDKTARSFHSFICLAATIH
jgi:putative transposase